MHLVTANIILAWMVHSLLNVLPEILDSAQVRQNRRFGIVTAHQFFSNSL
jgi:hypothetical protein